jgi:hypothetical protein
MKPVSKPCNIASADKLPADRWPEEKIKTWYNAQPWPVGCNYIPHYAINQLEMWQEESFNEDIISKELGWAANLGFNAVRVFLHQLLWEQDKEGFLHRMSLFLSAAQKHNIKTMFVLFDGVWDPYPQAGKQREPKMNVHNSGWVQCPGYDVLMDESKHDTLFGYVNGIVEHFKNDKRILAWDLYNEPDNLNLASYKEDQLAAHKADLALKLLQKATLWVRRVNPIQPLTMAPWQFDWSDPGKLSPLDEFMFTNSDIISFHCYEEKEGMAKRIQDLSRYKRPILCTEYMARPLKSTFQDILPLLKESNVGAFNWGFVAGKSQTHCPWDSWHQTSATEPDVWFHDIYRSNGEPYDKNEIDYLVRFNRDNGDYPPADN